MTIRTRIPRPVRPRSFLAALALSLITSAACAADVGVSVSVGQPGFYGRIDIGNFPRPALMMPQPVVIHPGQTSGIRAPIYLHVPPGHAKDWAKHCRKYNACGQPVYFVDQRWYDDVYVPRYRELRGPGADRPPKKTRPNDDERRDDRSSRGNRDERPDRSDRDARRDRGDRNDRDDDRGQGRGRRD